MSPDLKRKLLSCDSGGVLLFKEGPEVVALIEQLERDVALAKFMPLGDNHHNARLCPYCNPSLDLGPEKLEHVRSISEAG